MANSTSKTAGTRRKSAGTGSEALAACVARTNSENEAAVEHSDAADLTEANRRSLETFVAANVAIMDGMNALSAEMAAFGGKRLNANLDRSQSLLDCEDGEKALRVQSEFFEAAMRQYLEQAGNVMEIMASISMSFWTALDQPGAQAPRDRNPESGSGEST